MTKSELRQDLVSGDWILIAPGRAKRPDQFIEKERSPRAPKKGCPLEEPKRAGGGPAIIVYPHLKNWKVQIVPNKYPALTYQREKSLKKVGRLYPVIPGVGYHDLVVTRDHDNNFARLSKLNANLVFKAFQTRYLMFLPHKHLAYTAIFHNWGPKAGASIYHPHYQIVSIPVLPPDVEHSLTGSYNYFRKNQKCVHCVIIDWERRKKARIIFENKAAIVFAPFASRSPFEVRIFPKRHLPFFEDTDTRELNLIVEALQVTLRKIERALHYPDYNFFIHTAPMKNKRRYLYYHWHIEALPKISIRAGFELQTGIEINIVDPDIAAKFIKGA